MARPLAPVGIGESLSEYRAIVTEMAGPPPASSPPSPSTLVLPLPRLRRRRSVIGVGSEKERFLIGFPEFRKSFPEFRISFPEKFLKSFPETYD